MRSGRLRYRDRSEAGAALGKRMLDLARTLDLRDPLVLGLPRGGIPVAVGVGAALGVDVEAVIVAKVPAPGHAELAMGAVARIGTELAVVRHEPVIADAGVDADRFTRAVERQVAVLDELAQRYRAGRPDVGVDGRQVVVVDDGIATGASMQAAVAALRVAGATRVIAAAPVCSVQARSALERDADAVVCVASPAPFGAVGLYYDDFGPPSDAAVRAALGSGG